MLKSSNTTKYEPKTYLLIWIQKVYLTKLMFYQTYYIYSIQLSKVIVTYNKVGFEYKTLFQFYFIKSINLASLVLHLTSSNMS